MKNDQALKTLLIFFTYLSISRDFSGYLEFFCDIYRIHERLPKECNKPLALEFLVASILIVDDNEQFLDALKDMLELEKFEVHTAVDGVIAQSILMNEKIDAVLTDIQMPNMRGDELLSWAMKNKPVPFILMTGYSSLIEAKTALKMGAQGYLNKPFKMGDLIGTLNKIVSNKRTA